MERKFAQFARNKRLAVAAIGGRHDPRASGASCRGCLCRSPRFTTSSATCLPRTRSLTGGWQIRRIRSGFFSIPFTSSSIRRTRRCIPRRKGWRWPIGKLLGQPWIGVAAERCRHVHGVHLDAARVGAAGMGASRRRPGLDALRRVQLLDEQLLGRSGGGDRGCFGLGSVAPNLGSPAPARRDYFWFGSRHSCDQPACRRRDFFHSVWRGPSLVGAAAEHSCARRCDEAYRFAHRRNSRLHRADSSAYYNWRVTGSPVVFPHFIEQREITTAIFLWQHDKPPIPTPIRNSTTSTTIFCRACISRAGTPPKGSGGTSPRIFGNFFWGLRSQSLSSPCHGC